MWDRLIGKIWCSRITISLPEMFFFSAQCWFFLKGVWHEIFDFRFFSWTIFPFGPLSILLRQLNKFYENSRRNSKSPAKSPVSPTPATNTKLWIFMQIFIKIWNGPKGILRSRGNYFMKKTWGWKSRVWLPLIYFLCNPLFPTPPPLPLTMHNWIKSLFMRNIKKHDVLFLFREKWMHREGKNNSVQDIRHKLQL